jgi:uncharacterized membrane protein
MTEQIENTEITSDDKLWAALGYPIALIAIIVLFMEEKKNRPFIRYHAIQSIGLNVVLFIVMIILGITVVGAFCAPLLWFVTFWPAYDSYQGHYTELPVITKFMQNQNWI